MVANFPLDIRGLGFKPWPFYSLGLKICGMIKKGFLKVRHSIKLVNFMANQQPQQIKIKAKDEELKGAYSNLMQVSHMKEEFILDFFLAAPPQGILASRVIISPGHLKRMIKALQENVSRYEEKFGKIEEAAAPETPLGFKVEEK